MRGMMRKEIWFPSNSCAGRDLNSLILHILLSQEFVTAKVSKQSSVFLKLDFLKASDKAGWKFLTWTPGIGWAFTFSLLIGLRKLNTFMMMVFLEMQAPGAR